MNAPGTLWLVRALWLALPFSLLDAVIESTSGAPRALGVVAQVLFWALWAVGFLLTLVPLPSTLTGLRIIVAMAPAASLSAAVVEVPDVTGWVGLVAGSVAAVSAMSATVGDWFVDGSSYGDERRFALRPPAALVVVAVPLAWLVTVVPLAAGLLFLGAEVWGAGVPLVLAGIVTAWWGSFALWRLARRWLVFVPAGMTLVDDMALAEPIMIPMRAVARLGPAHVGTEATDLSVAAPGLVLQLDFAAPMDVVPAAHRGQATETVEMTSILIVPSRAAEVLTHAEQCGLSVSRS